MGIDLSVSIFYKYFYAINLVKVKRMALWGISTTTETADNNYAIPKYQHSVDRNRSPWNTFADRRGWIQRWYGTTENSGLSTTYYDEVLVPVVGLNTGVAPGAAGHGANETGLGQATPVAVFFEDPNKASPISVGGGGTTGIATNTTGYIHLVYNELVYVSAGATVRIRTFDANNANESTAIVGTAASVSPGVAVVNYVNGNGLTAFTNYNGQITNRVAFAFTSPSTVLTANVPFTTSVTTTGQTVAIGGTNIFVDSVTGVSIGSSLTVAGKLTNVSVVAVGTTSVQIGTASTISSTITAGLGVTFSTRTNATKLFIDMSRGFIGVGTDGATGVGIISSFTSDLIRQVGGAGTYLSLQKDGVTAVGLGTTTLTVR